MNLFYLQNIFNNGLAVCITLHNSVSSQGFKIGFLLKYNHDGYLIYITPGWMINPIWMRRMG